MRNCRRPCPPTWETAYKPIDLRPGDASNVIDPLVPMQTFAILGDASFLPDVEVVRSTITLSGAYVRGCATADVNADG